MVYFKKYSKKEMLCKVKGKSLRRKSVINDDLEEKVLKLEKDTEDGLKIVKNGA